ncbi:MAG: tripartite tricarboxylate transporter substrate binding protein [Burkholderiales bacterium]|nr:tripartite tricarboxylate transporter substrate binding protein [Burkholderiales bacterium]
MPWGTSFIVENKGGVGGLIGSMEVARAAPDGYTLLMGSTGPLAISPQLVKASTYDPRKDFTPVIELAGVPQMLLVRSDSPYKSVQDLIAAAKANPGQLTYGSGGIGSLSNLTMELFKQRAGVDIVHVPYKGAAPAYNDLLSGRLQVMFDTTPAALKFVQTGRLRFLAASTTTRTSAAPDVPTLGEAGLPGFDVLGWLGIVAPRGLAPAKRKRLNEGFQQALQDPEVRNRLEALGLTPLGGTPEQFGSYVRSEYDKFAGIIKTAKITPQ